MKTKVITVACFFFLTLTSFAQTAKPGETKKFDINDLYLLASQTELAEVEQMLDFKETLGKISTASNESACKYILGLKKFQRGNDDVFDTLVASQRLGNRVTGQSILPEQEIRRWVLGRAADRIAMNKIIVIFKCLPPEQVKEETQIRIIVLLKNLGNLTAYIEEAKKVRTLTADTSKEKLCGAFYVMKTESDKIEPDLEEFAALYIAEGDVNSGARSVEFAEPAITQRAEQILNIRAKLFLPLKSDIETNLAKYGCQ